MRKILFGQNKRVLIGFVPGHEVKQVDNSIKQTKFNKIKQKK